MVWVLTVALPLMTILGVYLGLKAKMAPLKFVALVLGCGVVLGGLWMPSDYNAAVLIAGGLVFMAGTPGKATASTP